MSKIVIDRAVLEQALKALESYCNTGEIDGADDLLASLLAERDLRPQVEQEPIAYEVVSKTGDYCLFRSTAVKKGDKVYAQPQPRQPLTPEAVNDLWIKHARSGAYIHAFARAIERAHGIGGGA